MTGTPVPKVDLKRLIDGVHDYLERALKPIGVRLNDLEDVATEPGLDARLADIERRLERLETENGLGD